MGRPILDFLNGVDIYKLPDRWAYDSFPFFSVWDKDGKEVIGEVDIGTGHALKKLRVMKESGLFNEDGYSMKFASVGKGPVWSEETHCFERRHVRREIVFPLKADGKNDWMEFYDYGGGFHGNNAIVLMTGEALAHGKGRGDLTMDAFLHTASVVETLKVQKLEKQEILMTPFERKALEFVDRWLDTEPVSDEKWDMANNMTKPFGWYGQENDTFNSLCDELIGKKDEEVYKFITDNREGLNKFLGRSSLASVYTKEYSDTLLENPRVFLAVMMGEAVSSFTDSDGKRTRAFSPPFKFGLNKDSVRFMKEFIRDIDDNLVFFKKYGWKENGPDHRLDSDTLEVYAFLAYQIYGREHRKAAEEELFADHGLANMDYLDFRNPNKTKGFKGFSYDACNDFWEKHYTDRDLMKKILPDNFYNAYCIFEMKPMRETKVLGKNSVDRGNELVNGK